MALLTGTTYYPTPVEEVTATHGGKGSFSYRDTSVYGPGQPGVYVEGMNNVQWVVGEGNRQTLSVVVGNPGIGGGAKLPGNRKFGSQALGYSPNGAVLLRVFKLAS